MYRTDQHSIHLHRHTDTELAAVLNEFPADTFRTHWVSHNCLTFQSIRREGHAAAVTVFDHRPYNERRDYNHCR